MLRVKFAQDPDPTIMLDDFAGAVDLKRFKDNVGEARDVLISCYNDNILLYSLHQS